jgi:hypothetical protein
VIRPATLDGWLSYIETLHATPVALGLERVGEVAQRMSIDITCPVVTVAGTNGKGSTCAMLESMLRHAGYRTGLYTSPHLTRFNERIRIDAAEAGDEVLVAAFGAVETARTSGDPVALTYFEFSTLAALHLFASTALDALVLEVGLGGRLDAVNVVDADVAIVTTIGIDHVDYLGTTRESIGREKAGIFRAGRQAICGDPDPPSTLVEHAAAIGAPLWRLGRDYTFAASGVQCGDGPCRARRASRFAAGLSKRDTRGARGCRAGRPVPGAAGTPGGRARRRAQSACRARARRHARRDVVSPDDVRRIRHAGGQGHRRRRHRFAPAHRPVVYRTAARTARRGRGAHRGGAA